MIRLLTYTYVHQVARFLVQNSLQQEWLVYKSRERRDLLHSNSLERYSCYSAYLCLERQRLVPEKKVGISMSMLVFLMFEHEMHGKKYARYIEKY